MAVSLAAFLTVTTVAQAQNSPHIGYVYPAGGRQGATFRVAVGGQFLNGVTNAHFSGAGIQATVLDYTRPLTQREFTELREKLRVLQEKRSAASDNTSQRNEPSPSPTSTNVVWTAEDDKTIAEIRKKLANPPNRQGNPAIAETVTLEVTMAPDAEPGEREMRLQTQVGLSNPLVFCVGQLPEFIEREANRTPGPRFANQPRFMNQSRGGPAQPERNITLPIIVNGQIMPGDVDRYRFPARQGQRLVLATDARALIPYLPDAVPGWFQATLALFDAQGNEVAYDDDFRFSPDPVLYYEIPKDGEYTLEIKDSLYRGREDFVYRITAGELPFVTSVFPLGGRTGTQTSVELTGWNLPVTTVKPEAKATGIVPLSVRKEETFSNRMPFAVDTLTESLENEPNDQPSGAQAVAIPLIVNGRIDRSGDSDMFRFEGRRGSEIVAEVYARRLNSPLDSVLRLTDASGRKLAANDDHEDKGAGLTTHQADSYLRATLPENGTYFLHLGDAQRHGGPEYGYRLRISPPQPDFELRVVPSTINARAGGTIPITVYALRKDGFADEIALALADAPQGFTLSGARVPATQDQVRLTLTVPSTPQSEPIRLHLEGRAKIDGQDVARSAIPAEDMMQAFAYRHLVPAKELLVAVTGRFAPRGSVRILVETPIKIPADGIARVQIAVPQRPLAGLLQLELSEPPEGISIQNVVASREGAEMVLRSDAAKVKPGLQGNLIVNVFAGGAGARANVRPAGNQRRPPVGSLPAIPFEIVRP